MIPHNFEPLRKPCEDAFPVVRDDAGLPVHGEFRAHHAPAEIMRHTLHTETHAKDGGGLADIDQHIRAHAEILFVGRVTRSGGNDDAVVLPFLYLRERYCIVAYHIECERMPVRRQYLPYVLVEVVRERVVIIYNKYFHIVMIPTPASSPRAYFVSPRIPLPVPSRTLSHPRSVRMPQSPRQRASGWQAQRCNRRSSRNVPRRRRTARALPVRSCRLS